MCLELKKFDITTIKDDKVIVLLGKRETGKTYLVKDILYYHQSIPIGTVISPTEEANKCFHDIVPNMFIHEDITSELLGNVLKRQKKIMKMRNRDIKRNGKSKVDPRAFLILDDCLANNKAWINDSTIRSLFMNGRHYKILFMITCQHPLGLPPNLRTNVDYVFILRENIMSNRRRIYENYAGMFPSFEVFCQVMDQCTENFECLVINNNAKSNKLDDQVFWYKAESHHNFRLGSPLFWQIQDENGTDSDESDDDLVDLTNVKKKKGPVINVRKTYG